MSGSGSGSGAEDFPELSAAALISFEEVRAYLQVEDGDDLPDDDALALIVNGVSSHIADFTGRTYAPAESVASSRLFRLLRGISWTPIDDCREISTVEWTATPQDDDSWTELTDWFAGPLSRDVKDRVILSDEARFIALASNAVAIRVTAKWGYVAVPDHVKLAALMWVQSIHRRDLAYMSDEMNVAALRMPPDVRETLKSERRSKPAIFSIEVTR